jgi:TnpA family transposase
MHLLDVKFQPRMSSPNDRRLYAFEAKSRYGTIHTLDWIEDKGLRADTTDELNKGEVRHTLACAVAFHRLGRFRDRNHDQQSHRAAALNLVTACIGLFNCRYLGHAVDDLRRHGVAIDDKRLRRLSPLGWDHINLTGDYVWSDAPPYGVDGMRPLNREADTLAA